MRIAIYIEKFTENFPEEKSFLVQLIGHMAHLSPQVEFILITTRGQGEKIILEKNITKARVALITNNTLVRKAWLNIKLPVLLKKYNADIFVSDEYCSLKTKIPQLLLITDHRVLIQQGSIERKHTSYKRIFPKFFKKAKAVICFSDFVKNEIANKYGKDINDLKMIPMAVEEIFIPLDETPKNEIKQDLTDGSEYFIYTGELNAEKSLDLIKAFSIFKKMQQSSMKLVLAGRITSASKKLIESLKTYKYRDAIIIKNVVSNHELVNLLGAAYALVLPSNDGSGIQILQAMRCGSAVISVYSAIAYEIAENSTLFFKEGDHSDMAAQMMQIYKDEDLRKELIEKSKKLVMNCNMDRSAKLLWEVIEDALK